MKILIWHVHGGWMDSFVRGRHEYLVPATPEGGPWGLGRAGRDWPASVRDVDPARIADEDVDFVVLQRPEELTEAERLLGRRLGRDVAAVYLEHNAPRPFAFDSVHPLSDRSTIPIVHVTHFNRLMWDNGRAPTTVIEHGIADPGYRYTGELPALGAVINEPVRRWRVTGTDLLLEFSEAAPVDVFGMAGDKLLGAIGASDAQVRAAGDLPTQSLHTELAKRRAYVHPMRWTSLGLSLLEAMHLGMPVLVLQTTEAGRAVPTEAGAISTDPDELISAARLLLSDPDEARSRGRAARDFVLAHYSLDRFLDDWDEVITEQVSRVHARGVPRLV
jgi:hypothetical protein